MSVLVELKGALATVNQLVTYITEERKNADEAIRRILDYNHPIFEQMRALLEAPYRVFFMNRSEMASWLTARQFKQVDSENWDDKSYEEWVKSVKAPQGGAKQQHLLKIKQSVFGKDGKLVPHTSADWDKKWVRLEKSEVSDDDIPF